MKFGINTFLWTAQFEPSHLDLLPRIKERGFDGIEMFCVDPKAVQAAALRRGIEAAGMGCTFCTVTGPDQSFACEDASVRARTVEHFKACIQTVAEAGGTVYAGPVYTPLGEKPGRRRTEDEWKRCVDSLQQLGPVLASCGVTLAIEPLNRFETYFLNTASDAARLAAEINHPNIGILFDTFHANIEEKNVAAAIHAVGPWLKHFHACENDRGTPGTGHVDWTGVFAAIKELKYDGWVTIESFGGQIKEIAAAACIWRDLAPTTDTIAWEGVRFLRSHLP